MASPPQTWAMSRREGRAPEDAPLTADGFPGDGRGRDTGARARATQCRARYVFICSAVTEEADSAARDHAIGR